MRLRDYLNARLDEGESRATVEGFQNNVRCSLSDALTALPAEELDQEIREKRKESDGQTYLWLGARPDPSYVVQE